MVKNTLKKIFMTLACIGIIDFIVQQVTDGNVKLIQGFLSLIFE